MSEDIKNLPEMVAHLQALVERDKTLLARELHDDLGGFLIAASMDIAEVEHRLGTADGDTIRRLGRIKKMLDSAIDWTRRLTEDLHPTLLDNLGLFAALRWQMKNVCQRTKLACSDRFPDVEPRFNSVAAITLFRIGQEALVVASEHKAVTTVAFNIDVDPDLITMRITGDGEIGENSATAMAYDALAFIRYRVRTMGGVVTLDHPANGGVALSVKAFIGNAVALH